MGTQKTYKLGYIAPWYTLTEQCELWTKLLSCSCLPFQIPIPPPQQDQLFTPPFPLPSRRSCLPHHSKSTVGTVVYPTIPPPQQAQYNSWQWRGSGCSRERGVQTIPWLKDKLVVCGTTERNLFRFIDSRWDFNSYTIHCPVTWSGRMLLSFRSETIMDPFYWIILYKL